MTVNHKMSSDSVVFDEIKRGWQTTLDGLNPQEYTGKMWGGGGGSW
jgi:hypothetical protein